MSPDDQQPQLGTVRPAQATDAPRSRADLVIVVSVAASSVALVAVFAAGLFAGYLELSGIKGQLGAMAERDRAIVDRLERVEERLIKIDDTQQQMLRQLVAIEQAIKGQNDRAALER